MHLKELHINHDLKCNCVLCNGTGIIKDSSESEFGFICNGCNGEGYMILNLSENSKLYQDEDTKKIYTITEDKYEYPIDLFNGFQKRDDVKYVMYDLKEKINSRIKFIYALKRHYIITYQDFLNGMLPIPSQRYLCPENLMRLYSDSKFKDDCILYGTYNVCNKSCSNECWKTFYGDASTYEEKQNVIKKILQKS